MQQLGQLSEAFWIELIKTGPTGVVTVGAFFAGVVSSIWHLFQNRRMRKTQKVIKEQTDGRLTDILEQLRESEQARIDLEARILLRDEELASAYAILSARLRRPVLNVHDIARATDFEGPRPGNGGANKYRTRRTDEPLLERKDDDHEKPPPT